jgi:hypothetical protein
LNFLYVNLQYDQTDSKEINLDNPDTIDKTKFDDVGEEDDEGFDDDDDSYDVAHR